jgi:hypothetical protein
MREQEADDLVARNILLLDQDVLRAEKRGERQTGLLWWCCIKHGIVPFPACLWRTTRQQQTGVFPVLVHIVLSFGQLDNKKSVIHLRAGAAVNKLVA